ncbi:protease modulator HflK [Pseudomonas aeruginosa]|uniref:protease modulator HflK n=1 Tax=Pseudomonas aeruginosa TaxID=287 RepID=UPI000935C80B|nr:protease modulator HflK [Pseudomonas aeruginosa]
MRVDLDAEGVAAESLPRFQQAPRQLRQLWRWAAASVALAAACAVLGFFIGLFAADSLWPPLLYNLGAAWLVLFAGLHAAYRVAAWRCVVLGAEASARPAWLRWQRGEPDAAADSAYERLLERLGQAIAHGLAQLGHAALWLAASAALALCLVAAGWRLDLPRASSGQAADLAIGICLLLAFAVLVLERRLASQGPVQWPEAPVLGQLARALIGTLVLAALCLFLARQGHPWAPRLVATSLLADLLRWPPRPLQRLQHELHQRFGIDLRQVWAFGFMRRAFLPVLAVVLLSGWLLSGVREIGMDARGVYERFGKPVAVLGPGLHLGLPWPLGRVLAVENGVVHELATSVAAGDGGAEPLAPAEGPAPDSANRLWDASHVSEKSQVIASLADRRQSFQIVNMDVRIVYRIALDDASALAATYRSADVPTLVRSTASRVLVHAFASRTLDEVLGEQRAGLAEQIGQAVQADLDRLGSGVEVLGAAVEAIHPPAGAANAYHAVQAAQITAQALIARERGQAAAQRNEAQLQASVEHDRASAQARETLAAAQAADRRFAAEREGYADAGQAFLLEAYYRQLGRGLGKANLLLIDHRIAGAGAPTIDLRSFGLGRLDSPSSSRPSAAPASAAGQSAP